MSASRRTMPSGAALNIIFSLPLAGSVCFFDREKQWEKKEKERGELSSKLVHCLIRGLDHVRVKLPLFIAVRVQRRLQCCVVRTHIACLGLFDGHRLGRGRDQGLLVGQGVRIPTSTQWRPGKVRETERKKKKGGNKTERRSTGFVNAIRRG